MAKRINIGEVFNHIVEMTHKYSTEIEDCIMTTVTYDNTAEEIDKLVLTDKNPEIVVLKSTTNSALNHVIGRTAMLNFASFKNAGGGYTKGMMAQEEALCHGSTLYNILSSDSFKDYYKYNSEHMNEGMYLNRALLTPNVNFDSKESKGVADVITCAGVNMYRLKRYFPEEKVLLERAKGDMDNRIKFVCSILARNDYDTVILGAYGCGVFRNEAEDVARSFKKYAKATANKKVIFAIPDEKNLNKFKKVFK